VTIIGWKVGQITKELFVDASWVGCWSRTAWLPLPRFDVRVGNTLAKPPAKIQKEMKRFSFKKGWSEEKRKCEGVGGRVAGWVE